jgi:2-polyprenyl-3-methyl-5-hydroxy-6-metoxy-1,4-benzoquinol methylase
MTEAAWLGRHSRHASQAKRKMQVWYNCIIMTNPENLSEKQEKLIHEWTVEQVVSASKPNFGKVFVTAPNLLKALGDIEGKDVLELGCGNGYWLRLLARAGAKTTGIDLAENQIAAAKSWDDPVTPEIDYRVGDVSKALDLQGKFDVAFFEHVLLEIPDKNELYNAVQNAANTLKEGGLLVISDIHPFAPSSRPDNIRIADDFNYFDSGASFEIQSKRIDGEIIYYKDVHWTLSDLAGAITSAGLKITEILEPRPTDEDIAKYPEELGYRAYTPGQILFKAEK